MKGLLATSTAFLHAECYAQRAVLLNKPTDAVSFGGGITPAIPYKSIILLVGTTLALTILLLKYILNMYNSHT